jgi:hypothetical protein
MLDRLAGAGGGERGTPAFRAQAVERATSHRR